MRSPFVSLAGKHNDGDNRESHQISKRNGRRFSTDPVKFATVVHTILTMSAMVFENCDQGGQSHDAPLLPARPQGQ